MSSDPFKDVKSPYWLPNHIVKIKKNLNIVNYNKLSDIDDYLILVAFTHNSWIWRKDMSKMLQEKYDLYNYEFIENRNRNKQP